MINKKELDKIIIRFWNNYLEFKKIPKKGEILLINHSKVSNISNEEIFIFQYDNSGIIISVPPIYLDHYKLYFSKNKYNLENLFNNFGSIIKKEMKIMGPIISLYLYENNKINMEKSHNVKKLDKTNDKKLYDDLILSIKKEDLQEIDINLYSEEHVVFILYDDCNNIVSLGNYSIDKATKIAHIGILTLENFKNKGYGKLLVNNILIDILENGLIPQYRADKTNLFSQKIAYSLGFSHALESLSIVTI